MKKVVCRTPRHSVLALAAALGCIQVPAQGAQGASDLAAASAAAPGSAAAQRADEMRRDLYQLDSHVRLGVGMITESNRRFGQYRGLTQSGVYGWLDADIVNRDEATGTWTRLRARNLGIDGDQDLRLAVERQGEWAIGLMTQQIVRREPLIVRTGLQGIGTGAQVVSATAPKRDVDLKSVRDISGLSLKHFVTPRLDLQFSYREDEVQGERMFGRGTSNVHEFLTEPIDRVTRLLNVGVNYAGPELQFTFGYNGSIYENRIPVLVSTGGNTTSFGTSWVHALPLSNQAQQLYFTGGWTLGNSGRMSVKLSSTEAQQNEKFDPIFVRLAGAPDSLNGNVVTTLGYVDLSLRPLPGLDVVASSRYEDRDDRTPEARFLAVQLPTVGGSFSSAGVAGTYKPRSMRSAKSLVEAGYRLPDGWRAVAGYEHEDIKLNAPPLYRRVAFREQITEDTTRLQFKRAIGETLNGSIGLLLSERGGSDYLPETFDPNANTNQVNPLLWADRRRERVRGTLDWTPDEQLSLQFLTDLSRDTYSGRALGPRQGEAKMASLDGSYKLSDRWSFTAFLSHEETVARQTERSDVVGAAAAGFNTYWSANMKYRTTTVGLGTKGKPWGQMEIGADLSAGRDRVSHALAQTGGTGTLPIDAFPDYRYNYTTFKLWFDQPLDRMSGVRLQVLSDYRSNNDWTWNGWTYNGAATNPVALRNTDGTTVTNVPLERTAAVAVIYRLRWR